MLFMIVVHALLPLPVLSTAMNVTCADVDMCVSFGAFCGVNVPALEMG